MTRRLATLTAVVAPVRRAAVALPRRPVTLAG